MSIVLQVAQQKGCTDGYRVTINDGVNGCKPMELMHVAAAVTMPVATHVSSVDTRLSGYVALQASRCSTCTCTSWEAGSW